MPLKKEYVKDANRRVVASVTSGYSADSEVVRDSDNQIAGRTSGLFNTTRDRDGSVASINSADPGLLIRRKK
jgi:hypothetical protein